jgi:hypothetical protein
MDNLAVTKNVFKGYGAVLSGIKADVSKNFTELQNLTP